MSVPTYGHRAREQAIRGAVWALVDAVLAHASNSHDTPEVPS